MAHRGRLIVIDGIDGAGKATQTGRLVERLRAEGRQVVAFDFPQYEGFFGQLIGEYLRGEYGDPNRLPPKLIAILYAADRWTARDRLSKALAQGAIVITNRYVPSNVNFQAARVPLGKRPSFRPWIQRIDYEAFGMPKEDATIFLHLSVQTSQRLVRAKAGRAYLKGKQRDVHERDDSYLQEVAKEYQRYCHREPTAHLIRCERSGTLLTIEQIHEKIWGVVQPILAR